MRSIIRIAVVSAAILAAGSVRAQDIQRFNLVYEDISFYNPAAAMSSQDKETSFSKFGLNRPDGYSNGVVDLCEHAIYGFNGGKILASVSTYRYNSFFDLDVSGGYSYGWDKGKHHFNLGAVVSLDFDRVVWAQMPVSVGRAAHRLYVLPDLTLGFEYRYSHFRAGASVINAVSFPVRVQGVQILQNPRAYSVHALYDIYVPKARLQLSPFVHGLKTGFWTVDMGLYSRWDDMLSLSYAYRTNESRHMITAGFLVPQSTMDFYVGFSWTDGYTWADTFSMNNLSIGLITWL